MDWNPTQVGTADLFFKSSVSYGKHLMVYRSETCVSKFLAPLCRADEPSRGESRAGARGARSPPTPFFGFWLKKGEMTQERKASWASKVKPGPLLSSKSGFATGLKISVRITTSMLWNKNIYKPQRVLESIACYLLSQEKRSCSRLSFWLVGLAISYKIICCTTGLSLTEMPGKYRPLSYLQTY